MEIITLPVGSQLTNCYLLIDEVSNETLIVDPGDESDFISQTIIEHHLKPQAIVLTHGHFDHCLGVLELKLNFHLPIYLNQKDLFLYKNSKQSADHFVPGQHLSNPPIDHNLEDRHSFKLGNSIINTIHTPGHTPGSICLRSDEILLTGDTLFAEELTDTSHYYSSKTELLHSLKTIGQLPPETTIYPGHGPSSKLGDALKIYISTPSL